MSDFTELLKFLQGAGASIIPWIVLAMIIWSFITFKPHIIKYIESRNDAKLAYIEKEGERNEIIRNCSATIENCTAALEMINHDRDTLMTHIDNHEEMSRERMEHIQTVVNQCRDEILKARGDVKSIYSKIDD